MTLVSSYRPANGLAVSQQPGSLGGGGRRADDPAGL
jgi:hypothetical protein